MPAFCRLLPGSSDSDFTRLASASGIRSQRFMVSATKKTAAGLRSACDRFIYTEVSLKKKSDPAHPAKNQPPKRIAKR